VARKVFFSFHFDNDAWRVAQIKNIGALERNLPVSPNEWEAVRRGGERAIRRWIDDNMHGRSCVIVLIGSETAHRPWVRYEIEKAWTERKGIVGVHIHNLLDQERRTSDKGPNPFEFVRVGDTPLSRILKAYTPRHSISTSVYSHVAENVDAWVEEAIAIRLQYR
jgi:hypothetical protein